jgi:hypothetical protein
VSDFSVTVPGQPPSVRRFWSKVGQPTSRGCREWMAYRGRSGYGRFRGWPSTTLAHRIAYEISNEVTVPRTLKVLHACDNPPCCEPLHLFIGTQADNIRDMVAKGRTNRNWTTTLTEADVKEIRRLSPFFTRQWIASRWGVSAATISRICTRRAWTHV